MPGSAIPGTRFTNFRYLFRAKDAWKKEKENIMKKQYRVAAVQASVAKFLDLDATVDKGVKIIEEVAKNGAELIVFPEAYCR